MAEMFRVIPDLSDRPAGGVWDSREILELARDEWRRIMNDPRQPEAMRSAAQRLLFGRIQELAYIQEADSIEWVLSE